MPIKKENKASQIQVICIEDLVPKNLLLRKRDKATDWSFCNAYLNHTKAKRM